MKQCMEFNVHTNTWCEMNHTIFGDMNKRYGCAGLMPSNRAAILWNWKTPENWKYISEVHFR